MSSAPDQQMFLFLSTKALTPVVMQDLAGRTGGPVASEIAKWRGRVFDSSQQSIKAVFASPSDAVWALLAVQQKLSALATAYEGSAALAAALHYGSSVANGASYSGETVRATEYLLSAANPGQYLLSQLAAGQLQAALPPNFSLRSLGTHRLKDLTRPQHVSQLLGPGMSDQSPALRTLDRYPNNLPILPNSLIGREQDVLHLTGLITEMGTRLVTLIGPSGTGKSRLSLQVAAELLESFPDGVFFIPLQPIDDPELLVPAICQPLQIRGSGKTPLLETLKTGLKSKRALLILDNFEQLIESAPVVGELLEAAPDVTVLVTSHVPLELPREYTIELPPLGLPTSARFAIVENLIRYPAVALFIERARSMRPDFEVTRENAETVAALCLLLRGLPLAIELVAAYSDRFTPEQMLSQLQERLDAEERRRGPGPETHRQRQLRVALEWSYELLAPAERTLFARLGIFIGGGTTEAVVAICGDDQRDAQALSGSVELLLKRNLLFQEALTASNELRWSMLDMVHDYARQALEQGDEATALSDRHAASFLDLVERGGPELTGPEQRIWLDRMEREYGNLRAALRWLLERRRGPDALSFITNFWKFWQFRGYHTEGRAWFGRALALAEELLTHPPRGLDSAELQSLRAKALYGAGWLVYDQNDYPVALHYFEESLSLAQHQGDLRGVGLALQGVGDMMQFQGNLDRARSCFVQAREIFSRLGDHEETGWVLDHLGRLERFQGNVEAAVACHAESLRLFEQIGHEWGITLALNHLAVTLMDLGDYARAKALLEPWLAQRAASGDERGVQIAYAMALLGEAQLSLGELDQAQQTLERCLRISEEGNYPLRIAHTLFDLARLAALRKDYPLARRHFHASLLLQRDLKEPKRTLQCLEWVLELALELRDARPAAQLYGAVSAMRQTNQQDLAPAQRRFYDQHGQTLRSLLGAVSFEELRERGKAMSVPETLELALDYLAPAAVPG